MAVNRKVVRVNVETSSSTFEADLKSEIDTAAGPGDWKIAHVFQMEGKRDRLSLIIILEEET